MAFFKKVFKSDAFKVAAGAAAGYALNAYAPELGAKATEARKWVQQKRNSLFPRVAQQAAGSGSPPVPSAYAPEYQGGSGSTSGGRSLLQAIIDFLTGRG